MRLRPIRREVRSDLRWLILRSRPLGVVLKQQSRRNHHETSDAEHPRRANGIHRVDQGNADAATDDANQIYHRGHVATLSP
jgi:hypothetical protein